VALGLDLPDHHGPIPERNGGPPGGTGPAGLKTRARIPRPDLGTDRPILPRTGRSDQVGVSCGNAPRNCIGRLRGDVRSCCGQPPTAPDRMNAKTRGKMWRNSPPPQESTSPPARSIASQRGSADRTKSSAVAASTSSTVHTSATISRRESAGRSASESRSMVKRYARPAASVLIGRRPGEPYNTTFPRATQLRRASLRRRPHIPPRVGSPRLRHDWLVPFPREVIPGGAGWRAQRCSPPSVITAFQYGP
jgi:hypothetical protein